jgi:hypothetical protein
MELFGEQYDPGQKGTVTISDGHITFRSKPLILIRAVVVIVLVSAVWWLSWPHLPLEGLQRGALMVGVTLIYVSLSYLIRPEPAFENMGWLGGLMDNPVRYSDDINRSLLTLRILLDPGRFVAVSLVDLPLLFYDPAEDVPGAIESAPGEIPGDLLGERFQPDSGP